MSICYIVGAVKTEYKICKKSGDYIIAADKGYENLGAEKADLVLGDFDSLGYVPEGENVLRFPEYKDDTDTMLAVKIGLEKGYGKFVITGGMGGRLDHTIANIQTLAYLATHGAKGYLVGDRECAAVIKNSSLSFTAGAEGNISVFAVGTEARGITLEGLKYPLDNATLTCDFPLGVSNSFTGLPSKVTVGQGMALIIWSGGLDNLKTE